MLYNEDEDLEQYTTFETRSLELHCLCSAGMLTHTVPDHILNALLGIPTV